jgi:hypothetical protein
MASRTSRSDLRRAVVLLVGCARCSPPVARPEAATAAVPTLAAALRPRRRAGVHAMDDHTADLARDLPETALHGTSRRPTPRSSAPPFTWAVMCSREVLHGDANPRRIDGEDGVTGSIPAGAPPQHHRSGRVRRRPAAGPSAFNRCLPELCQLDLIALSRCTVEELTVVGPDPPRPGILALDPR